jgi:poly(ADP-ribose) glycohydrolase ARH3
MTPSRDRIRGCILGGVVGDAFGAPLEGSSASGMATLVERRSTRRTSWGYTDDSAMLLACCDALTSVGTIEARSVLQALASRYEPARGFGRGMKIALAAFASGAPWEACAFAAWPEGSRGNGGAVRIPPVAVARWGDAQSFDVAVRIATRVTHAHEQAIDFARLHATAIAVVLDEPGVLEIPNAFHDAILARLAPKPTTLLAKKLDEIFELVGGEAITPERAARVLGTSTLAVESVPAALWSFVSRHASFSEAVSSAALLGGDVDSICCLVGALAGALHGADAIDRLWISNLSHERPSPDDILALADALCDLVATPPVGLALHA